MNDPGTALKLFLKYQQVLLAAVYSSAVVVYEKSRRIGISWAMAAIAVLHAAAARSSKGQNVFYMGYNLEMAREFIDVCGWWCGIFGQLAGEVEEIILEDEDKDIKAFRIKFNSGFEIIALPSNPRSLRGMQGLVIIDEAAFHDELGDVLKAALALIMWGGKVVIVSTHDGDTNPFNELVNDVRAARKPYTLLRTTFDDALDDDLYRRICETQKIEWTAEGQEIWKTEIVKFYDDDADEELYCIPSEGPGTFLSGALVEARMQSGIPVVRWEMSTSFGEQPDHIRKADCLDWCERNLLPRLEGLDPNLQSFFGEDFGRSGDLSCIWPYQKLINLVRHTPFIVELRNIPFQQQEQILYYIVDRLPRFTAGALDARGNGQYLAERAMQRYGAGRIAQVMLSTEWYRENMPRYKAAFEDALITLPRDANVLADHRAIIMEKGIAKVPDKGRSKGTDGKQRHGDTAIAGAIGYFATCMDVVEYDYEETTPGRSKNEEPSNWNDEDDDGHLSSGLGKMNGAF